MRAWEAAPAPRPAWRFDPVKKSLLLGFTALLLLLALDAGMSLHTAARLRVSQSRIVEVAGIRIELRALLAAYVDAETGVRGYLLTGEESYLNPYHAALATIERSDLRLKSLLTPEKELTELRGRIEALGSRKMASLERMLSERREQGPGAAVVAMTQGKGRELMDDIRALAAQLDAELASTMKGLLASAEQRLAFSTSVFFGTSVIVAAALIGLFFLTRRHFGERESLAVEQRASHARVETLLASERAAHSEATHANKLKDEFLSVVSHELRTPLNAILGWTTLLREGPEDANELKEGLDTIDRNAQAQARLIDDLLDVSRIISGKVRLRISEVDLRALALAVVDSLRPAADARGVEVAVLANEEANEVLGDPDRLQQVLWNLVSNAIKFTPRGGKVAISVARAGSSVALEVRDTGQGIRAAFLPRIFDRFSQQDASASRGQSGLGLGLSITRHLVELHGGTISARSEGEGLGATFRVEIPMIAVRELQDQFANRGHETPSQPIRAGVNCNARLDGLRILAVDDQADTLAVVERVLTRAGAEVRTVLSVADALAMLRVWEPGCIVSDIGMPVRDGYSFMRAVRLLLPPLRTVPAVALTAFARDSDRALAIEAGFNGHLAKPVDTGALLQKVASLTHRV
jgi:signal transduction histidine kinase/ActR/RegA family two-component response regulator